MRRMEGPHMGTPAGGICPYRVKVGRKREGGRGTEGGRREAGGY